MLFLDLMGSQREPNKSQSIFFFLSFLFVAQLHACVVCIALPIGLVVVPTQGFILFLLFLENKHSWLGGGSKG